MRWCLDELPEVRAAADRGTLQLLPLAAWLVARLTGDPPRIDPANASRTLLWDSGTRDWSPWLLELFGIPRTALPDCVATQADFGTLRGLSRTPIPLCAVTGDQSAVPFFAGAADPASAYLNLGTGAFAQRPLRQRAASPEPLLGSVLCSGPSGALYSLEGTVNGAGAAIGTWAATEGVDETTAWRDLETRDDQLPAPLFVNTVGGLGSPWWRSGPPARFIGDADRAGRFAAVVESIACLLAENLRLMTAHGARLERVQAMGGLSRSDWLCRRLAAACDMPVERVGSEATARGAAALAAPDIAARWPVPARQRFEPITIPGLSGRQAELLALLAAG
jgi:glycerol kinase